MLYKATLVGFGSAFLSLLSPMVYGNDQLKLTFLYNNVPFERGLKTGWGFSCLVQGLQKTILFDTGGEGDILLSNMRELGVNPGIVDLVVLSHNHGDHTGGLWEFLEKNPHVIAYVPESFPKSFKDKMKRTGAKAVSVCAPMEISKGVHTTGEMGAGIIEQSLMVESQQGLILITGCAHPGIVEITKRARQLHNREIFLAAGGFHLTGYGYSEIWAVASQLKEMGVKKIAPSHCTGELAIKIFKEYWKDDFLNGGCGATITIP